MGTDRLAYALKYVLILFVFLGSTFASIRFHGWLDLQLAVAMGLLVLAMELLGATFYIIRPKGTLRVVDADLSVYSFFVWPFVGALVTLLGLAVVYHFFNAYVVMDYHVRSFFDFRLFIEVPFWTTMIPLGLICFSTIFIESRFQESKGTRIDAVSAGIQAAVWAFAIALFGTLWIITLEYILH